MPIEGVWTGEVYGPFGWDNRGVFVFEHGRIIGGDHRQYCSGAYSQTGHDVKAEITFHYYGPPRPGLRRGAGAVHDRARRPVAGGGDQRRDPPPRPAPVRPPDPPDQAHGPAVGLSRRRLPRGGRGRHLLPQVRLRPDPLPLARAQPLQGLSGPPWSPTTSSSLRASNPSEHAPRSPEAASASSAYGRTLATASLRPGAAGDRCRGSGRASGRSPARSDRSSRAGPRAAGRRAG